MVVPYRLFVFAFFELAFESFHGVVDGFFEGVGYFGCHDFGLLGLSYFYYYFLVHGRFRFHYLKSDVDGGNRFVATGQFFRFLVDKSCQTVGDVKMDCLNTNFHIILLFFVRAGAQVDNFVLIHGTIYVCISV